MEFCVASHGHPPQVAEQLVSKTYFTASVDGKLARPKETLRVKLLSIALATWLEECRALQRCSLEEGISMKFGAERNRYLPDGVNQLPHDERVALILTQAHHLSLEEAALVMGVNTDVLCTWLMRACACANRLASSQTQSIWSK